MQEADHDPLCQEPEQHAEHHRESAQPEKLARIAAQQNALTQSERLQNGARLQAPPRKIARRLRHRHRGHQRRDQRDQMQKIGRPLKRLLLRRAAVCHRLHTQAAGPSLLDLRLGPVGVSSGHLRGPCDGQPIGHPARRLYQAGRRQIDLIHHHARREIDEARPRVGLSHQNCGDMKTGIPQLQHIADLEPQRAEHPRIHPDRTRRGRPASLDFGPNQTLPQDHLTDQGVMLAHRLERHQASVVSRDIQRHAREHRGAHGPQALLLRPPQKDRVQRMVAHNNHIAADQLSRVTNQCPLQALRYKPHRRQRSNRKHQRKKQEAQFAPAPITPELFE